MDGCLRALKGFLSGAPFLWLVLCLVPVAALAGGAAERYAPLQLGVAREALQRARQLPAADRTLAAALARQASLDARLAWAMSDSRYLRKEAAGVFAESEQLLESLGTADRPIAIAR